MWGTPRFYFGTPFIHSLYKRHRQCIKIGEIIMFADDTTLFFKHKELGILYTTINIELAIISQWFKLNELFVNIKKKPTILSFEIKILQQLTRTLS